jgi:hypothetical protein
MTTELMLRLMIVPKKMHPKKKTLLAALTLSKRKMNPAKKRQ